MSLFAIIPARTAPPSGPSWATTPWGEVPVGVSILRLDRVLNAEDPTRTISIRKDWAAEVGGRFGKIISIITQEIGREDALGIGPKGEARFASALQTYKFARSPAKIQGFNKWMDEMIQKGVFETILGPRGMGEPFTNRYIRTTYQRGLQKGWVDLKKSGVKVPAGGLPGGAWGTGAVQGAFYLPFHQKRVELLYTRVYEGMKGITDTMRSQMSRVLAQGIAEGIGPTEIARGLNDRVRKIGITRSKLIARTETIHAYNQAFVWEMERLEPVVGEEIKVRWWTAQDERVRSSHRARHNQVYSREEAQGLLGGPNCRCTLLPVLDSVEKAGKGLRGPGKGRSTPKGEKLPSRKYGEPPTEKEIKSWSRKIGRETKQTVLDYTDLQYRVINPKLRSGAGLSPGEQQFVSKLDQALEKGPRFQGKSYRGMYLKKDEYELLLKQFQTNEIVSFPSYTSTSADVKGAYRFLLGEERGIIFEIEGKTGTWLNGVSTIPHEKEILFGRNSVFRVVGMEPAKLGGKPKMLIKLAEVTGA